MSTFDRPSFYYSGQGLVHVAARDAAGKPRGFLPLGNCSKAELTSDASTLEHKESQSGSRATDLRLTTDLKVGLSLTLENLSSDNLALAFRGDNAKVAGASLTAEAVTLYNGKVLKLLRMKVSAVALKRGATVLTAYVNDATPYDYKLNPDTGTIQMNDGAIVAVAALTTGGTVPTAITVGATTSVTVANTAAVGDYVVFTGFAGADAALINGKALKIVTASATVVTLDLNTTGKTITLGTPLSAFDGTALNCDYTFATQYRVDAFTQSAQERTLLIEGINTADGNNPVAYTVFRFVPDPAAVMSIIGDENIAQLELKGSVLSDALQTSGSKFFREDLLRGV
ncbi:MAG: hypothetical protein HYX63_13340 [Gammaproteobacteria bacterium]|nr:hypothetical protein [Gammaproteobacteria bacterium]